MNGRPHTRQNVGNRYFDLVGPVSATLSRDIPDIKVSPSKLVLKVESLFNKAFVLFNKAET